MGRTCPQDRNGLPLQPLPALRTCRRVSLVSLTAVKTGIHHGRVPPNRFRNLLLFVPGHQVEGKKKDNNEKDTHGPEEALADGIAMLLGIEKDPEGDRHIDRPENKFQDSPRRCPINGRPAFVQKSTHSTPWAEAPGMLRVDNERRSLPRFKNRGLAPSNVSDIFIRSIPSPAAVP
jgi:hypothetical protein